MQVIVWPWAMTKVEARHKSAKAPPTVFPTVRNIVCFSLFARGCSGTAWDSCSTKQKRIQPFPRGGGGFLRTRCYQIFIEQDCIFGTCASPHRPHVQTRHAYAIHALVAHGHLCGGGIRRPRGLRGDTRVHARLCRCGRRWRDIRGETHGCQTQQRQRAQDHRIVFIETAPSCASSWGAGDACRRLERAPVDGS